MHPEMEMLRCAIVRGGTSKGVFIMKNEYPEDPRKETRSYWPSMAVLTCARLTVWAALTS